MLFFIVREAMGHGSTSRQSHFTFPKTCKEKTKNIGFLWHGICIVISQHMFEFGADIRIFKQKMCKCSIVRDTI